MITHPMMTCPLVTEWLSEAGARYHVTDHLGSVRAVWDGPTSRPPRKSKIPGDPGVGDDEKTRGVNLGFFCC